MSCGLRKSLKADEEHYKTNRGGNNNKVNNSRAIVLHEKYRYTVYIAWKKGLRGYGVAYLMTDHGGRYVAQYCNTIETDDKTMIKLTVVRDALRQAAKANVQVRICMEEMDKRMVSVLQGGGCKIVRAQQQWKYQCLVEDIKELKHVALAGIAREECEQEGLLWETKRWAVTSSNIKFSHAFNNNQK